MTKIYTITSPQSLQLNRSGTYVVNLTQSGAEVFIRTHLFLKKKQQLNLNLTIIHHVKNTTSHSDLRIVVDDSASAYLTGTIMVRPQAQKTQSFLSQKILLLSPHATAQVIPNLEIEANDVHCSHAASAGQIDPEQIFYLQSRGLTLKAAKAMIASGFLQPNPHLNNLLPVLSQ